MPRRFLPSLLLPCVVWLGCGAEAVPEVPVPDPEPELVSTPVEVFAEVQAGQTFGTICAEHGIPYADMLQLVEASEEIHDLTRIRAGRVLQMRFDPDSDALLDLAYPTNEDTWIVLHGDGGPPYTASLEAVPFEVEAIAAAGEVTSSFWAMCTSMGLRDADIIGLAEIFEYDIDFATEVQAADRLAVWIESLSLEGAFAKYGRVLAARYQHANGSSGAYLFTPTDGEPGYYTSEGLSTRKMFLRSPLKFGRVSSGFSRSRFHPILHRNRAHLGTDFSAPRGTAVRALGDGRVTFAGWRGGYGNLVIIQHTDRYTTRYGHLHKFGKGIKKGATVEQGWVIGQVGSTGMSTGPHLHFEFRIHGKAVDFMRQDFPNTEPIARADMPRFEAERDALVEHLDQLLPVPTE